MSEQNALQGAPDWDARRAEFLAKVPPAPLPSDLTIPGLIERASTRFGDRTALRFIDDGTELTFAELESAVRRVADGLHRIGVVHGTRVAVMASNRPEFPITWLALATLGAVMVPINTTYVAAELTYVINDAGADFVVTEDAFLDTVAAGLASTGVPGEHVINLDEPRDDARSWQALNDAGDEGFRPGWEVDGEDLLNVQYTSGTTGLPKGCLLTQRYWIVAGATSQHSAGGVTGSFLTDHSYYYMDPQWQLTLGLYSGVTINVARRLSASRFVDRIIEHGIESAWLPRPIINMDPDPKERQTRLRSLFIGGGSAEAIAHVRDRFGIGVRDVYGMTEIGSGLMVPRDLEDDPAIWGTCGLPAPWRECVIMLPDGTPAAPGEEGELWVRGDSIFRGYHGREQATDDAFVGDWFRTGDLFVQTSEGYFRIVGRIKDMIRRSSENISSLEVEQAMNSHSAVAHSAVVGVPDDYRGEEVKIFVLLAEGHSVDTAPPAELLDHCAERLAPFKVPRFVAYVDELPFTPTMKIAKHELTRGVDDLRLGAWDRVDGVWREPAPSR